MENLSEVKPAGDVGATEAATGADGKIIKMEEDWSSRTDEGLKKVEGMLKAGRKAALGEAVDVLMTLEKGSRLAGDSKSNRRVILAAIDSAKDQGDWARLNDLLHVISKKRSLIKQSISAMVERAAGMVEDTPDLETKLALIDALRKVTDGKIYVEVERARLTYKLVKMREAEGKVEEAAKLLLDLQIETFGSMDRKEKVGLLLEQMRLSLLRKDFTRAQIISRKISTKFFADKDTEIQGMKIRFYEMMITVDLEESAYLSVSRHYTALVGTPKVAADKDKVEEALKASLVYAVLAPHAPDQLSELHRLQRLRAMERLPDYKQLAELMTTQEMVDWAAQMEGSAAKSLRVKGGVLARDTPDGDARWEVLHTRVAQHNIRVIANYYSRISLDRMAQLLSWPLSKTEDFVADAVVEGTITAKIDRPSGVVSFRPTPTPAATLDQWASDLHSLMDKLNLASHLIQKEEMVHKHLHAQSA